MSSVGTRHIVGTFPRLPTPTPPSPDAWTILLAQPGGGSLFCPRAEECSRWPCPGPRRKASCGRKVSCWVGAGCLPRAGRVAAPLSAAPLLPGLCWPPDVSWLQRRGPPPRHRGVTCCCEEARRPPWPAGSIAQAQKPGEWAGPRCPGAGPLPPPASSSAVCGASGAQICYSPLAPGN